MEPKQSLTRYVAIMLALFLACALTGIADAPLYTAAVVFGATVVLDLGYRAGLRRSTRARPPARAALDRLVRLQCLVAVAAGLIFTVVGWLLGDALIEAPAVVDAAVVAGTVAITAVFVSALVDWYWILPRIGGLVRRATCEETGGQTWARVTGVWLAHRGIATLVVSGALSGVALYMGQRSNGDAKTAWLVVAGVLAAATVAFNAASLRALWNAFNPKQHVGDLLDIHGREVYVVDVSLQGVKYKRLDRADAAAPRDGEQNLDVGPDRAFGDKRDGTFPLEELGRYPLVDEPVAPCATRCTAINAYCRHNPAAYG